MHMHVFADDRNIKAVDMWLLAVLRATEVVCFGYNIMQDFGGLKVRLVCAHVIIDDAQPVWVGMSERSWHRKVLGN